MKKEKLKKTKSKKKKRAKVPISGSKKKKGIFLVNPKAVRRLVQREIKLVTESKDMSPDDQKYFMDRLRVIAYSVNIILRCFELGDFEERIKLLEQNDKPVE